MTLNICLQLQEWRFLSSICVLRTLDSQQTANPLADGAEVGRDKT